jgi:hypothetical protein
MVERGIAKTAGSARQMLFHDCRTDLLISVRTWGYAWYQLKEKVEEKMSRKIDIICSYFDPYRRLSAEAAPTGHPENNDLHAQNMKHSSQQHPREHSSTNKAAAARPAELVTADALVERQRRDNAAYSRRFPSCQCGAFICDSCLSSFVVVSAASLVTAPVVADVPVVDSCSPPRSENYGLLGAAWADYDADAAFDALDILHENPAMNPLVHDLYFMLTDWDSVLSDEFEALPRRNRMLDSHIKINFNGAEISAHVERFKNGAVLVQCNMTDSPIFYYLLSAFKRALHAALPAAGIAKPLDPETWTTVSCDVHYDLPMKGKRVPSHTEIFKGFTIHAYCKRLKASGKRVLRIEVMKYNPATKDDYKEFFRKVARANTILLESVGIG